MTPRSNDDHDRRRDGGFSFVEVAIAIALLGVVVIAMVDAVAASVSVSSLSRSAAQIETTVVNAADRINRAPVSCDYTVYAQAAAQTQGWPASLTTVTQEYLVADGTAGGSGVWLKGSGAAPACPGQTPPDLLVQRVVITVRAPDSNVSRSIEVVKSDV